jgi:hypothetical protein
VTRTCLREKENAATEIFSRGAPAPVPSRWETGGDRYRPGLWVRLHGCTSFPVSSMGDQWGVRLNSTSAQLNSGSW